MELGENMKSIRATVSRMGIPFDQFNEIWKKSKDVDEVYEKLQEYL